MVMVLGINLSPTKVKLLKLIFKHRGMTVEQATCGVYPREFNIKKLMDSPKFKNQESKVNFIYKQLQKLRDKDGLLQTDSLHPRKAFYYFLNRRGFEVASTLLDIPLGKKGTGYNGDYGDFDYDLYRPPHRQIAHHMNLVNFFLMLEHVSANNPTYQIDYRDNRYISVQYPVKSSKKSTNNNEPKYKIIKPDGEFRLREKWYWVEIDNSTEFFENLKSKFEGYADYLDYLKENNSPIPEGIIFVTEDMDNRRWGTVTRAFFHGIGEWASTINLMAGRLSQIEGVIEREVWKESWLIHNFIPKIRSYIEKSDRYIGTKMLEHSVVSTSRQNYEHVYSVTKTTDEHVAFVYEVVDGYETRGFARALEFKTSMIRDEVNQLNYVTEVIPVFILNDQKTPPPLIFESFTDDNVEEFFNTCYWLNIKEDPTWLDVNGKKLDMSNPLVREEKV